MSWAIFRWERHVRLCGAAVRVPLLREVVTVGTSSTEPLADTVPSAELTLTGDLARPVRLSVSDLAAWPQYRVRVSFERATSGVRRHRFAGPLLHDVLRAAGPVFDPARRKDRLRFLIAVTGADGHHVLLSWAEIDPDFGHAPVLLATRVDDTSLEGPGPQLVLPQDRCGARYVSGVDTIRVDGSYGPWT
ncbi:hypothetical protein AB0C59_15515 [Streptomyces sp. NPDC048664]|uniref:hypothetical protein n=1 Tax=Streptomyces sp. NPDC048664 TaxID=3154505 RepID=UPI003430A5E8